jgi:septum site-determining protein MinC
LLDDVTELDDGADGGGVVDSVLPASVDEDRDAMAAPNPYFSESNRPETPGMGTPDSTSVGGAPSLDVDDSPLGMARDDETSPSAIRIRGRTEGVSIEIGEGPWDALMLQLDARLEEAAGFFRGGQVVLDVGSRGLSIGQMHQVRGVFTLFGLKPGMLRTTSPLTFESALASGMAVTLDEGPEGEQITAQPAESNQEFHTHYVYRGNLRSGQLLQRDESILVIGDVNPGAQLISNGDILIWGRLRGVAHAGAAGAEDSVIGALLFEPTQLRIGNLIAISPDKKPKTGRSSKSKASLPARIAYVVDNRILVADWNEARRGGKLVLRR